MRNKRAVLAIVFAHLGLTVLGAAYVNFLELGKPWLPIALYSEASGAASNYGFFSPSITGQLEAKLEYIDRHGKAVPTVLASADNPEAQLRIRGILGSFSGDPDDQKKFQRSMAASLAGTVFARHPEAAKVNVRLEEFTPVSMAEYRQGARAQWKFVYEAGFVHE